MVAAVLHLHEGARAALDAVDQMQRRSRVTAMMSLTRTFSSASRPNDARASTSRCSGQNFALSFSSLPRTSATSGMSAKRLRLGLRRAAGDHDLRAGALALEPADRLARLPHRLGGHRAGVDHDRVVEAGAPRLRCGSPRTRRC